MSIRRWLALLAVLAATLGLTVPAMASTASHATSQGKPSGTKIILAHTAFGWSLAVGSGPFKNYTLYFISSDNPPHYGCTTVPISFPGLPPGFTCTGPSNDQNAEWPAITTNGKPIAGPGVIQALLGRVYRKGIGWQVTYAGHPLYLFDKQPGAVTGEGWFEPGVLPWHGIWWLMSRYGQPVPWAGTLTTTTLANGKRVLAETYQTGIGFLNFPVYTFSGDSNRPRCSRNTACARAWPPVLTSGTPGTAGVPASSAGRVRIPFGLTQTTWNGQPLYLFSNEQLILQPNGSAVPAGNGNGITAFGGTFSLVNP